MKHENKTRNKLIASVMCLVMIGATLFAIPWFSVQADDTATSTTAGQSYGAWSDMLVTNGSFEAGYNGKEVYGWHKTAMVQGHGKQTDPDTAEDFCDNFTLTTAVEPDGNKVAALTKNGAGFVAATSEKIGVTGGREYRLSFDYKTESLILKNGVSETQYYGIRLYVEEWSADGEILVPVANDGIHYYGDDKYNSNWSTGMAQFQTKENTTHVVVYLWMGGTVNVVPTVYFDNILLEVNDDYKVVNGDFDQVTYKADGERTQGQGPVGWTVSKAEGSELGKYGQLGTVSDSFKVTTVTEEGRGNVALVELSGKASETSAYALLQSPYIPVESDEVKTCHVAADCKLLMYNADGSTRNMSRGIFFNLACYNANKEFLGNTAARNGAGTELVWKKWSQEFKTIAGTKYVRIGLSVNFLWGDYDDKTSDDIEPAGEFELYYDNVVLDVADESLGFTQVTTQDAGKLREDSNSYTKNYGIQKVNGGVGYENAYQLYVTRENGTEGAATFYSTPIAVTPGRTVWKFDYKVEGVVNADNNFGADVVLRYRNSAGEFLNEKPMAPDEVIFDNRSKNTANTDGWQHMENVVTVPENAATVEIGLLIGGASNYNRDMKNTFANLHIAAAGSPYWNEHANDSTVDLLFKLTERGNAFGGDESIDVFDLVMMKKYAADSSLITENILINADMNMNTLINNADIELLHWKLLGVDTETEAGLVQGYKFKF